MSEALFADLALPSGRANKLTPARRAVLVRCGRALLQGISLYAYGSISSRGMRHCLGNIRDKAEQRAVIGMRHAGWLRFTVTQNYGKKLIELVEPWASVAKRLAGADTLREERMQGKLDGPSERVRLAREEAWRLGREWEHICPTNRYDDWRCSTTADVLKLYDACLKAQAAVVGASAALESAKVLAEQEAQPTDDEVITWLVAKALTREKAE